MDLTTLLNSTVGDNEVDFELGIRTSLGVGKGDYSRLHSYRNVLSYSMSELLHACPRKYQIQKQRAATGERTFSSSATFAFGHAVGAGVAVYDKTQDLRAAIWAGFLSWNIQFDASGSSGGAVDPKESFPWVVNALEKYADFYHSETDLADWEVVEIEAALLVDLETENTLGYKFYDTGHADVILRNKHDGRLRIKENKTSGRNVIHPAMYSNSDQALGYSVVASCFGETDYEVMYTVYTKKEERWVQFDFPKSILQRAEWMRSRLLVAEEVDTYSHGNFFPTRGSSCFDYSRECPEYGSCTMNLQRRFGQKFSDLQIASEDDLMQIENFTHRVTLTQVKEALRTHMAAFTQPGESNG